MLQLGQFIAHADEDASVYVPLEPGEASLHHGWTVHASSPNVSTNRRIGLNVQFLAPPCRQLMHDGDTALLVRGEDRFHHFGVDSVATVEVDLSALERQRAHEERIKSTYSVVRDLR